MFHALRTSPFLLINKRFISLYGNAQNCITFAISRTLVYFGGTHFTRWGAYSPIATPTMFLACLGLVKWKLLDGKYLLLLLFVLVSLVIFFKKVVFLEIIKSCRVPTCYIFLLKTTYRNPVHASSSQEISTHTASITQGWLKKESDYWLLSLIDTSIAKTFYEKKSSINKTQLCEYTYMNHQ